MASCHADASNVAHSVIPMAVKVGVFSPLLRNVTQGQGVPNHRAVQISGALHFWACCLLRRSRGGLAAWSPLGWGHWGVDAGNLPSTELLRKHIVHLVDKVLLIHFLKAQDRGRITRQLSHKAPTSILRIDQELQSVDEMRSPGAVCTPDLGYCSGLGLPDISVVGPQSMRSSPSGDTTHRTMPSNAHRAYRSRGTPN